MKLTGSEAAKKRWANPERRKRQSLRMKQIWASPEYKEKMTKIKQNPEYRKKRSELTKKQWADPEYNKKTSMSIKKAWTNPELREKMSKFSKERWANPEYRKKTSETCKESWADPELRVKQANILKEICADPEHQEKMSLNAKRVWKNPEYRAKRSGEKSSQWLGGISFEPYPPGFNPYLKKKIRERDGCKCVLCDGLERLSVHHINYLKDDLRPENLITLCTSCHSKTGGSRDYWEAFLTKVIEQKEPLKFPLMGIESLSQDSPHSIIGGINDGA